MKQSPHSLSVSEKISYGLGDTASNFFFQTFNIFLLYYYTDVFGISAAAVGTMFFVSKLWDALNDPIMGIVADRTETRWGKFRPYLLWMALPYGVLGYVMFLGPELSPDGKLLYAWITYSLMMMAYTAINVPYSALMGVMSPSSVERTTLASYRFVCAFGGGFLITLLARPLIFYFGEDNEARGFTITMALFGICSVALFLVTFLNTRERVSPKRDEHVSVKADLRLLLRNKPWLALFFAAIFSLANVAVRNAVTVHYFKYFVGDDGERFLWFMDKTTLFMSCGMLALIAGVASTPFFAKRFDKRRLMIALTFLNAATMSVFFFIPPDQFALMMVVNIVGTFFAGPAPALVWAMYADTADYSEWKFGRRATGLIFSAALFAQKFGLTIGGGLSGWMLAAVGFQANQVQTDTSLLGIRLMYSLIPAAFAVCNAVAIYFYNITDEQMSVIESELRKPSKNTVLA